MYNKEKETPQPAKPNYPRKPDSFDEKNLSNEWQKSRDTLPEEVSMESVDEQDTSAAQNPDKKFTSGKGKDVVPQSADTKETSQQATSGNSENTVSPEAAKYSKDRLPDNTQRNINEKYSDKKDSKFEQKK